MSVRIKLNNRKFLGEGLLIGSRLNEEGEATQQSTENATTEQPANNAQTATPTTPVQPAANNQQSTDNGQQQQQGPTLDQQVNKIIYDGFSNMVQQVEGQFKQLQLPEGVQVQWVQVTQPKDQTLQSVWASVQQFLTENIKAVTTALQQKQNAQQSASQDSSTAATAQQK